VVRAIGLETERELDIEDAHEERELRSLDRSIMTI
jgi:hypothetical protein